METRKQYVARKRREFEAERWKAESEDLIRRGLRSLDDSPLAKGLAGDVAGLFGAVGGVGRGVVHDVQAVADGLTLAGDLINREAVRRHAAQQVVDAAHAAAAYVRSRASDGRLLLEDARRTGDQWNRDLNPDATPVAATFADEVQRRFDVGMNQGEALYNVASVALPVAGQVKGMADLGRFAEAGPAKYIKMGATPQQAAYLAERDFETMGHHSIAPRRAKMVRQLPVVQEVAQRLGVPALPQALFGDAPIPKVFLDSPFNVIKPGNVERGQFYRRHYRLDEKYHGGPVSDESGGGGWSGRKLGWSRYGPVERLWHGAPFATKTVILAPPAAFDLLGRAVPNDEQGW